MKFHRNVYFCSEFNETPYHLLIQCNVVDKMWSALKRWLHYIHGISTNIGACTIILNDYTGKDKAFVNCCLLIMKQYIYATKCMQEALSFMAFYSQRSHHISGRNDILPKRMGNYMSITRNGRHMRKTLIIPKQKIINDKIVTN